ncbi:hypothetical protein E2C01_084373 [Portunus trituberculatus]|uniref:Uncharacterized protein n=1 Tax=Portunus trituberculatus TaxID=210409 RepID=A0A5B7J7B1_PORTR|nr:hypothetical protein [Portunus trituberculatus]
MDACLASVVCLASRTHGFPSISRNISYRSSTRGLKRPPSHPQHSSVQRRSVGGTGITITDLVPRTPRQSVSRTSGTKE